jgi:hypothetical protein
MAYTDPPTFIAADPLTAAEMNVLSEDIEYLYAGSVGTTFAGVQISRSTNQSCADSVMSDISMTSEAFDYGGWWASGAGVTVPAGVIPAGFTTIAVLVTAYVKWATNGSGMRKIELQKGGTAFGTLATSALSGETTQLQITDVVVVAAGDVLNVSAWQNTGGALNVTAAGITVLRYAPVA